MKGEPIQVPMKPISTGASLVLPCRADTDTNLLSLFACFSTQHFKSEVSRRLYILVLLLPACSVSFSLSFKGYLLSLQFSSGSEASPRSSYQAETLGCVLFARWGDAGISTSDHLVWTLESVENLHIPSLKCGKAMSAMRLLLRSSAGVWTPQR